MDFDLLKEMRDFLQWRSGDAIMLAEANVPPDESIEYFGAEGDRLQMMLNFPVNQRLFYALATGDLDPLIWALEQTSKRPRQRAVGAVPAQPRRAAISGGSPTSSARRCSRPSARRSGCSCTTAASAGALTPMLGNDRRRLELAFSLLFSLPGTPMMQYGDEIGIGDDLRCPSASARGRRCSGPPSTTAASRARRTWSGRSSTTTSYGYKQVNVADQRRDPNSLLNWTERMIRVRKECPEISWGDFAVLRTNVPEVLAHPLRLAQYVTPDAAQLQQREADGEGQGGYGRTTRCSSKCSTVITAKLRTTGSIVWRWTRRVAVVSRRRAG